MLQLLNLAIFITKIIPFQLSKKEERKKKNRPGELYRHEY